MISPSIMTWSLIIGIISVLIPIAACVVWKRFSNAKIWLVLLGAVAYLLFGQILITVINSAAFAPDKFNIDAKGGVFVYIVYMVLIAAVCEELGKFIFFKLVLKPCEDKVEAVSLGLGYGGFAMILTLGANCLMYRMVYGYLQSNDSASLLSLLGTQSSIDSFTSTMASLTGGSFILMLIQQAAMMAMSVVSTFFVFMAARYVQKARVLIIILAVHAIALVPGVMNSVGILPLWAATLILVVITAIVAVFGIKEYKVYVNTKNYDPSKSKWAKNRPVQETPKGPKKGGTKKRHK